MQQTQMPGLSGVTGCSELHDVGSECVGGGGGRVDMTHDTKLQSLKEQREDLTAEPSLQPSVFVCKIQVVRP